MNDDLFSNDVSRAIRQFERSLAKGVPIPTALQGAGLALVLQTGNFPVDQVQASYIVEKIREGLSIKEIFENTRKVKISRNTFRKWKAENAQFAAEVESAFEDYFHDQHEHAIRLSDELTKVQDDGAEDDDPKLISVKNRIAICKLQIETRLKVAEKLCPNKFGNLTKIEHSGVGDTHIEFVFDAVPDYCFVNEEGKFEVYPEFADKFVIKREGFE